MALREAVFSAESNCVHVNRLEWLSILRKVPVQEESDVNQMVHDLLSGSENSGGSVVLVETWQAKAVCELVPETTAKKKDDKSNEPVQ